MLIKDLQLPRSHYRAFGISKTNFKILPSKFNSGMNGLEFAKKKKKL